MVIERINAIGTVKRNSKAAIEAARSAYEALTQEQKALVTNYSVLTDAEAALAALEPEGPMTAILIAVAAGVLVVAAAAVLVIRKKRKTK